MLYHALIRSQGERVYRSNNIRLTLYLIYLLILKAAAARAEDSSRGSWASMTSDMSEFAGGNCTVVASRVQPPRRPYRTVLTTGIGNDKLKTSRWVRMLALCSSTPYRTHRGILSQCSPLRRRRPRHQPREKCVRARCREGERTDGRFGMFPASRARGEYLRTHFKNMREVAAALTG